MRILSHCFCALDSVFFFSTDITEICQAVITACRGIEKIKTTGFRYIVVAGLPDPLVNHESVACEVENPNETTDITQVAVKFAKILAECSSKFNNSISFQIGINSDKCAAGIIGHIRFDFSICVFSVFSQSYDLWGDAITIAARMAALAPRNSILITEVSCHL